MTAEPELDKLIIQNLEDLDATAKRIDALTEEIRREVFDLLQSWAKDRDWLVSEDPDDPWVAPHDWYQDDDYFAWFQVDWGPGDTGQGMEGEAYFDLSRLAGVGGAKLCVWLWFEGVKAPVWKSIFRQATDQAKAGGFSYDDKDGFYIDCTPSPASLAAAVADDDFAAAFEPLTRALDAAHAAWPIFDQLLKKARA